MLATRLRFRLWPSWNRYLVYVILITTSMLHPADDGQQARNSIVQGCTYFSLGSHTLCYHVHCTCILLSMHRCTILWYVYVHIYQVPVILITSSVI